MSDMEINIDEFEGVVEDLLDKIANADFTPALEECRAPLAQGFSDIFSAQVSSEGETWPAHSPVTVAIHGPHELLILTTALLTSLTDFSSDHYELIQDGRTMEYGTTVEYAAAQNYGKPDANLPAREYMFIREDTAEQCFAVISNFVDQHILGV